jgi:pantoate--beta-alanine ligase
LSTPVVLDTIAAVRARVSSAESPRVGLVPTMGALHAGHGRLLAQARRDCTLVVVSIFVNPLQFDREDDLRRYPRTLAADVLTCAQHGVDVVFAPHAGEVYPRPQTCTIDVGRLGDHLCGRFRPGHFRGVATVVMKLFQMVQPDAAYFGEKDAQQLAIVRSLAADFNVPIEIVGVPTVREPDGLAMSSRNAHLNGEERAAAPALYAALQEARRLIESGVRDAAAVRQAAASSVPARDVLRLEYLEIVDPDDVQPVTEIRGAVLVAGALWVGATRLIDNILCDPSEGGVSVR